MSDSDSDLVDPDEERRIREEYGLQPDDGDEDDFEDGASQIREDSNAANGSGGADEQTARLRNDIKTLAEEKEVMKDQVNKFEDLSLAMAPVDGVDPAKFLDTVMVDGREVAQDYRDIKIRDLSKKGKAINVKVNALREENKGMIEKLASAQMKVDVLNKRQEQERQRQLRSEQAAAAAGTEVTSPREQKKRKMRAAVEESNQKIEMLNLRGEYCDQKMQACASIIRNELGLPPGAEVTPEVLLSKSAANTKQRKQAAEELSMAQTEVKRLKDKVTRVKKELANPNFQSRASLLDVDRQAEQDLEFMNRQRQEALQELRDENQYLGEEIASHQTKIRACKMRVQGLSQERQKHLHQLARVKEKMALDAQIVAAYEAKSARLRKELRDGLRNLKADHDAQRRDTEENMANAAQVLEADLHRKDEAVYELQQQLRMMKDETSRLKREHQRVANQASASEEVRKIRELKKANSELWDIIQDYERKFGLTQEALESHETQLRHEERKRDDLQRKLALSVDDKGRTVTVRLNEQETLQQQLDALVQEEQVMKTKYREREKEVDHELAMYQDMCSQIRSQLVSSAGSRRNGGGGGGGRMGSEQDTAALVEENNRLRDELHALRRTQQ